MAYIIVKVIGMVSVSKEQAEKIKSLMQGKEDGDTFITAGNWSGSLSEIRSVDTSVSSGIRTGDIDVQTSSKRHWIIYHPKRNIIWKQSFKTFEEARAELDFQSMGNGGENGWKILERP